MSDILYLRGFAWNFKRKIDIFLNKINYLRITWKSVDVAVEQGKVERI